MGVAALSRMQRFEPRYLEAVDPAIAATLGVGVGWLAARARHGRAAALGLAAGAAIVAVAASAMVDPPRWATTAALAGAAGALICAVSAAGRRLTPVLAACALVAAPERARGLGAARGPQPHLRRRARRARCPRTRSPPSAGS